ncbi:hypothetical protein LYNGBM3L_32270 [Moorena producens 3L]|uniref:Uncharacterized protein n=1 Tax=Moorena producens 3L TaxID=489825 RepID=F4XTR0_9CYAN|nr:hypothetical protein [Moorena producens]EGJ31886.1 hypothetical protein LYNGBM3L_32270 [Moorena producens 3L]OLT67157.1 hypothetical protein BI334_20945 [Moorena producens 3L]
MMLEYRLTEPQVLLCLFPIPNSLGALSVGELNSPRVAPLPIPNSQFLIPDSRFPIPFFYKSQNKKNSRRNTIDGYFNHLCQKFPNQSGRDPMGLAKGGKPPQKFSDAARSWGFPP